jgi:hypothetical protein
VPLQNFRSIGAPDNTAQILDFNLLEVLEMLPSEGKLKVQSQNGALLKSEDPSNESPLICKKTSVSKPQLLTAEHANRASA